MSQPLHQNSDSQQPDVNPSIQHQADCSKVETKRATVQGDGNRVIQGNNNRAIQGDNNIAIQGDNNTTFIIQLKKSKKYCVFIVFAALISLSFAIINSVISPKIQTKKTPIYEGQELLDKGELKRAEEKFNEVQRLEPKSPEPWYWKARVALARRNQSTALEYLNQALNITPRHSHSLALQIKLLLLNGGEDINKAHKIVSQSYNISPELDLWLNCLNQKNIFNSISTTESELNRFCRFPDINNKNKR